MRRLKKKNALFAVYVLLVIITMSTTLVYANENSAIVIAGQGMLRSTADFNGEVIQSLPIGTEVLVQETKNDWYQVVLQDNATKGWMYKDIIVKYDEKVNTLKKGIINVASVLNVRSVPSTEGTIISKLSNGTEVSILSIDEEWYQIQLSTGVKGFVHSDFVDSIPNYPQAKVTAVSSNIYENPTAQSKITVILNKNDSIYIKNYDNGWYNILTKDFIEGWIKSEEAELQINVVQPVNRSGTRTNTLSNIKSVSEKYLGKPYKYASAGPNSFDCSGFVYYIMNTYYKDYLEEKGINLPRSSRDQTNVGTRINRDQLQVGDLVFFNSGSSSTISHVGIYIGNNEFIHASSTPGNAKIIISPLNTGHYNGRYSTAVRL